MSVTSGFFNSLNGDRRYNAEQMAALFNGIITDGVFENVGNKFVVKAVGDGSNRITVNTGRAWLNSLWLDNDSILPLTLGSSDVLQNRYDAVILEMDKNDSVRKGDIKIITGTPASSPAYPTMTITDKLHQYPLCYIYRPAGSSEVTQSQIKNMIGTSSLPYVTGILQVQDIDEHFAQWEAQWNEWFSQETNDFETWTDDEKAEYEAWLTAQKNEFDTWFASIKAVLSDDVAAELASRVASLENGTTTAKKAECDSEGNVIKDTYSPKTHTHTKSQISDFSHTHTKSQISDFPTSMTPTSHTHSANQITAGRFAGDVKAYDYGKAADVHLSHTLRNIYGGTTDMVAGSTALSSGEIYVVFE